MTNLAVIILSIVSVLTIGIMIWLLYTRTTIEYCISPKICRKSVCSNPCSEGMSCKPDLTSAFLPSDLPSGTSLPSGASLSPGIRLKIWNAGGPGGNRTVNEATPLYNDIVYSININSADTINSLAHTYQNVIIEYSGYLNIPVGNHTFSLKADDYGIAVLDIPATKRQIIRGAVIKDTTTLQQSPVPFTVKEYCPFSLWLYQAGGAGYAVFLMDGSPISPDILYH